ncbi:MAG TPA: Holliday junction resolvase RuvX [Candidatus Babeliales bacterium]|nr:Holliday junction resolvase RuvX [Candidatus Babeliales bacterium]
MHHNPKEFIGVDVGDNRVGIARGSDIARIAEPLRTVDAVDALAAIASLSRDLRVSGVVVGLPRGLGGDETSQTKTVKDWAKTARQHIKLPFYWQDEALTTKLAEQGAPHNAGSDAVAASIILQDFLDTPENDRVEIG